MFDVWPIRILSPSDIGWRPAGGVDNGGKSLSGITQLDRLDGGPFWRASHTKIPVHTREGILCAQAVEMLIDGGAGVFIVPRRPSVRSPGAPVLARVSHSDETTYSDGTEYVNASVAAWLTADALLYDSTISAHIVAANPIIGGEEFSLVYADGSKRMHRIRRVLEIVGAEHSLEIGPPLREDTPALAAMDFDDPGCVMTITNPEAFSEPLTYNRYGWLTAEFEEAFF